MLIVEEQPDYEGGWDVIVHCHNNDELSLVRKALREIGGKMEEDMELMVKCVRDAREVAKASELKGFQSDLVRVAIALFEKRWLSSKTISG